MGRIPANCQEALFGRKRARLPRRQELNRISDKNDKGLMPLVVFYRLSLILLQSSLYQQRITVRVFATEGFVEYGRIFAAAFF